MDRSTCSVQGGENLLWNPSIGFALVFWITMIGYLNSPYYCMRIMIVQWASLWYSAPSSLNNDLLNDGVILEMYNRVTDVAIGTSIKIPCTQTQTPRRFFLVGQERVR